MVTGLKIAWLLGSVTNGVAGSLAFSAKVEGAPDGGTAGAPVKFGPGMGHEKTREVSQEGIPEGNFIWAYRLTKIRVMPNETDVRKVLGGGELYGVDSHFESGPDYHENADYKLEVSELEPNPGGASEPAIDVDGSEFVLSADPPEADLDGSPFVDRSSAGRDDSIKSGEFIKPTGGCTQGYPISYVQALTYLPDRRSTSFLYQGGISHGQEPTERTIHKKQ